MTESYGPLPDYGLLTDRQRRLIRDYGAGVPNRAIVERHGLNSEMAIYVALRKAGVTRRRGRGTSRSWVIGFGEAAWAARREAILAAYAADGEVGDIAAAHGVTVQTVYNYLRQAGVKLRTSG